MFTAQIGFCGVPGLRHALFVICRLAGASLYHLIKKPPIDMKMNRQIA